MPMLGIHAVRPYSFVAMSLSWSHCATAQYSDSILRTVDNNKKLRETHDMNLIYTDNK